MKHEGGEEERSKQKDDRKSEGRGGGRWGGETGVEDLEERRGKEKRGGEKMQKGWSFTILVSVTKES